MYDFQKKRNNFFYTLLSMPATATGFALSVQIATLSWIMSTQYDLNIEEVGFVWLAGPLAGIIAQPLVGLISDNIWLWGGRRRAFIWVGGFIAALTLFLLPNLDTVANALPFLETVGNWFGVSKIIIVALFVALGLDLAVNVGFNPTRSIISDVTPEGPDRTKGFTVMQSISNFFGLLAYGIGYVFDSYVLIYFGVVLILLFSIIPPLFIKEPRHLGALTEEEDEALDQQPEVETDERKTQLGELLKLYIAHGFTWLGAQTMFVFLFAFAKYKLGQQDDDAISDTILISFFIMNLVATFIPFAVFQPLSRRFNQVNIHNIAIASMAIAYFGILFLATTPTILYILMALVGVGWAATVTLPFPIMSELVAPKKTGLFMGIFNLSVVLPQVVVSQFVGGYIEAAADKNIIFIICGTSLAISAVAWLFVKRSSRTQQALK